MRSSRNANTFAVAALAFGAFVIGTAELVVVGILNLVAHGTGVSQSAAGNLVVAYALGIAIGAPVITAATTRFGRRTMLLISLAVFAARNLLAAISTSFGLLLLARVLTGSIHGLFLGVASVIAAGLVPAERRGQAISMVFGGIAVSTVIGVPAGTLIGQALGWQAAFLGVTVLATAALIVSIMFVPPVAATGSGGLRAQARAAFAWPVLAMLAVGLILMGGQFTAFTYLTPFLGDVTGITGGTVSVFLLAYGIAAAIGTLVGGRSADRNPHATLLIANIMLIAALAALHTFAHNPALVVSALAAWGMAGFSLIPAVQLRVITLAGAGQDLAATLGASSVNAGIAVGSVIGGIALAHGGADTTVLVAMIIAIVVLPATWATRYLDTTTTDATVPAHTTTSDSLRSVA